MATRSANMRASPSRRCTQGEALVGGSSTAKAPPATAPATHSVARFARAPALQMISTTSSAQPATAPSDPSEPSQSHPNHRQASTAALLKLGMYLAPGWHIITWEHGRPSPQQVRPRPPALQSTVTASCAYAMVLQAVQPCAITQSRGKYILRVSIVSGV